MRVAVPPGLGSFFTFAWGERILGVGVGSTSRSKTSKRQVHPRYSLRFIAKVVDLRSSLGLFRLDQSETNDAARVCR